jgi:sortase A
MSEHAWRKINIGLLAAIILVNLYTILLPTIPALRYRWEAGRNREKVTASVQQYVKQTAQNTPTTTPTEDMSGNRLIIPRMLMNTKIVEGPTSNPYGNLKKGAWRLPFSSTPDKGGNTVIAGHRFTYTEARSIFYYLDKLQIGDQIGVEWNGTMHTYKVVSTEVVSPTDVSVQAATDDDRLTLYTCTPLWNPKNRLVVIAKPIGATE